jgi:AcrR family transcriptional regulator
MTSSKQPPGPRKRHPELLDIAATVFHRKGYSAATVRDIANEFGILKGSLYYYIDTKEDLLYLLLTGVQDDVERLRLQVTAQGGLGPLERLDAYIRLQAEYNIRNLVRIRVFMTEVDRLSGPRRDRVLARRTIHHAYVEDLVVQAQALGLVRADRDPTVLRHCVFASIVWTYRWYRQSGNSSPSEVAELCSRFALRGLRTPSRVEAAGGPEGVRSTNRLVS